MSAYERMARQEDEAEEDELVESQIEELIKLQDYDYFWKGFNILCWNNVDFFNKKIDPVDIIDKKIKDEWRCLWYILLLPIILFIVLIDIFK